MSEPQVSVRVVLEVDNPRHKRVFEDWALASGLAVDSPEDEGCGCCVNIFKFFTAQRAAAELDTLLNDVGLEVEYLGGTPSQQDTP